MPPKKGGPAGAAEVFIYDDCFTRAMKIKEANLKPGKPDQLLQKTRKQFL